MEQPILRLLIQEEPPTAACHAPIQRVWDGPGRGETCDGCGER